MPDYLAPEYLTSALRQEAQTTVSASSGGSGALYTPTITADSLLRVRDIADRLASPSAMQAGISREKYRLTMSSTVRPLVDEGAMRTNDVCVAQILFYDGQCTPEEIARTGPRMDIWSICVDEIIKLLAVSPTRGDEAVDWVIAVRSWMRLGIWAIGLNPDFLFLTPAYYTEIFGEDLHRTQQIAYQGDRWPRHRPLQRVVDLWRRWQGAPISSDLYASFAGTEYQLSAWRDGQMRHIDLTGPAGESSLTMSAYAVMGFFLLGGKPQDETDDVLWAEFLKLTSQKYREWGAVWGATSPGVPRIIPERLMRTPPDATWTIDRWIAEFFAAYPDNEDLVVAWEHTADVRAGVDYGGSKKYWVPGPRGVIEWVKACAEEFRYLNPAQAWLEATQGYMRNHLMFFITNSDLEGVTAAELAAQADAMQEQRMAELEQASAQYASLFLSYIPVIGQIIGAILMVAGGWLQKKVMTRIVFGTGRQGCPQPLYIRTMADPSCSADLIATGGTLGEQAIRVRATTEWLMQNLYGTVGEPENPPPAFRQVSLAARVVAGAISAAVGAAIAFLFKK